MIRVDPDGRAVRILKKINTFALVCFAWIFFRANSLSDLGLLLTKLFTDWQFNSAYFVGTLDFVGLTVIGAVTSLLSVLVLSRMDSGAFSVPHGRRSSARYVYAVWAVVIAWALLMMGDGSSNFIYFQF